MRRFAILLLGTALIIGCASTTPMSAEAAGAEVLQRSRGVVAAEAAGDLASVMPFFEEAAILHIDGAPPITGSTAIRAWYAQAMPAAQSFRAETSTVAVSSGDDLAYETGTNYLTLESAEGSVQSTSKYLAVWRRGADRQWRLAAISVTNNPR